MSLCQLPTHPRTGLSHPCRTMGALSTLHPTPSRNPGKHPSLQHPNELQSVGNGQERERYERQVLQLTKKRREGQIKRKKAKGGQWKEEALLETKRHRRISRRTVSTRQTLSRPTVTILSPENPNTPRTSGRRRCLPEQRRRRRSAPLEAKGSVECGRWIHRRDRHHQPTTCTYVSI